MISFQSSLPPSILVLMVVLKSSALDKYIAAVYEHSVILPESTPKPVSSEDALMLMNRNMDVLEEVIKRAAAQVVMIVL